MDASDGLLVNLYTTTIVFYCVFFVRYDPLFTGRVVNFVELRLYELYFLNYQYVMTPLVNNSYSK